MTINLYAAPIHLIDDLQEILDSNLQDKRLEKAFRDVQNDVEALHYLLKSVDKWQKGEYSNQTMYAAYNIFRKTRGQVSYEN